MNPQQFQRQHRAVRTPRRTRLQKRKETNYELVPEPKRTIAKVWNNATYRKVFLDILHQTQLKKCKQLRLEFVKTITECLDEGLPDEEIYARTRTLIDNTSFELKRAIQHQGQYRGHNRSVKILDFVAEYYSGKVTNVLDVGCGDGSITKALQQRLSDKFGKVEVHGCDILQIETADFFFSKISDNGSFLSYPDSHFEVVYALMSLHHVKDVELLLSEIYRVVKPGGLLIIREHDCTSTQLAEVLDIVHGFYAMVWSNPQEHESFEKEYFGCYRTAIEFDQIIRKNSTFERLYGSNKNEVQPTFCHGKVVNPMKYYWAVYERK